ncbi:MAG: radical SAM protein [candidate division WOR-3 bacterium]
MNFHKNFFNVEIQTDQGLLLYNILNQSFVLLEKDYEEFYRGFPGVYDQKLLQEFVDAGFLVSDMLDERKYFLRNFKLSRYYSRKLLFTIVPTTACNFRCSYCFEKGIPFRNMTDEVAERVKSFIKERVDMWKPELVEVTYYGGEPLLYTERIVDLGHFFRELSVKVGFKLKGDIVTNGYMLDLQTAKLIHSEAKVSSAQITLDGPPKVHDKRRPLHVGGQTFNRIIENIRDILNSDLDFTIRVRINVDRENIESLEELLSYLNSIKNEKVEVYFSPVTGEKDKYCEGDNLFSIKEFAEVYMEKIVPLLLKFDFKFDLYPNISYVFCGGVTPFHYVIDSDGSIKKCFDVVGKDEESIGFVENYREEDLRVLMWETMDLLDEECERCKFLPVCGGGCPYFRLRNGYSRCEMWRYILEPWLLKIFELKREEVSGR